jgi:hypothetical protein
MGSSERRAPNMTQGFDVPGSPEVIAYQACNVAAHFGVVRKTFVNLLPSSFAREST